MQKKVKVKIKPKKKGGERMDTELRKNVLVSQVKKEDAAFVKSMEDQRKSRPKGSPGKP